MLNINNPYLNLTQKIELYERWLLVHSYLYYELNEEIKNDFEFDNMKKALLKLKKLQKKRTRYSAAFNKNWNGSCYNMYKKLPEEIQESIKYDCKLIIERRDKYGISPSYSAVTNPSSSD